MQECFLACVRSRDDFEGRASFRSYLFAIARNHLLNWLQRDRPKADAVEIGVTSIRDLRTSITGVMDREDRHRRLIAALHRLPLDLQIALELFYFDGLRGHELAEVLGIPHATVRSRLRRARELLAEAMAVESLDPAEFTALGADLRKKGGSS